MESKAQNSSSSFPRASSASLVAMFDTFEDYLDSEVTETDMNFVDDLKTARQLVELGYRGSNEVRITRDEFEKRKEEYEASLMTDQLLKAQALAASREQEILSWENKCDTLSPFLRGLALRLKDLWKQNLQTIVFLRVICSLKCKQKSRSTLLMRKPKEVSGFIDLGQRLLTEREAFNAYFTGKKLMIPEKNDLSVLDWQTYTLNTNASRNFRVISDPDAGLLFKSKRDRKLIDIQKTSSREEVKSSEYEQVIFFDHYARKRC